MWGKILNFDNSNIWRKMSFSDSLLTQGFSTFIVQTNQLGSWWNADSYLLGLYYSPISYISIKLQRDMKSDDRVPTLIGRNNYLSKPHLFLLFSKLPLNLLVGIKNKNKKNILFGDYYSYCWWLFILLVICSYYLVNTYAHCGTYLGVLFVGIFTCLNIF